MVIGRVTQNSVVYATVLLAGCASMALEMAAARLYAPYLGASLYIWGGLISVVMAAMAIGYALGGHFADRAQDKRALFWVLLASGLYQIAMMFAAQPLLLATTEWSEAVAVLLVSCVLFAPPVALLAAIGPLAVQELADERHLGRAAGRVFAISTIGSIVGVLVASFWLLPTYGTHQTRIGLCVMTMLASLLGLVAIRKAALLAGAAGALLFFVPTPDWGKDTIWVGESAYNLVRVVERHGQRQLILDQHNGSHGSTVHSTRLTQAYWDVFAAGPLLTDASSALVLGLGAGTSVHTLWRANPEISVDAVEIDPLVVEVAERFFELTPSPKLTIHTEDARRHLRTSRKHYDIVQVDLFHHGPHVPFHLATAEFFSEIAEHLNKSGVLMMNVVDPSKDQQLLGSFVASLRETFPTVLGTRVSAANHILLAFPLATTVGNARARLRTPPASLRRTIVGFRAGLREYESGSLVMRDDKAPIEALTRTAMRQPERLP